MYVYKVYNVYSVYLCIAYNSVDTKWWIQDAHCILYVVHCSV